MTEANNKTLIMGAAVGYTEEQIAPFLVSLRKAGYRGDVALIVEPALVRRFSGLPMFKGTIFLTASQWFPVRYPLFRRRLRTALLLWLPVQTLLWVLIRMLYWLPLPADERLGLQIALAQKLHPPTESRYLHYFRFLRQRPYARVLLTDVRDVLFQSDPFANLPQTGLAVSIETRQYSVATEQLNATWVRLTYGTSVLRQIADNPVSCSGITYGDEESILRYLELMVHGILGLNLLASRYSGIDQGIHNVLLWTKQFGPHHGLETLASPVATLSGLNEGHLRFNSEGKLLNTDGSTVSVIHQYDRIQSLKSALLRSLVQ